MVINIGSIMPQQLFFLLFWNYYFFKHWQHITALSCKSSIQLSYDLPTSRNFLHLKNICLAHTRFAYQNYWEHYAIVPWHEISALYGVYIKIWNDERWFLYREYKTDVREHILMCMMSFVQWRRTLTALLFNYNIHYFFFFRSKCFILPDRTCYRLVIFPHFRLTETVHKKMLYYEQMYQTEFDTTNINTYTKLNRITILSLIWMERDIKMRQKKIVLRAGSSDKTNANLKAFITIECEYTTRRFLEWKP